MQTNFMSKGVLQVKRMYLLSLIVFFLFGFVSDAFAFENSKLAEIAQKYIGRNFSKEGIQCKGFVQKVVRKAGRKLDSGYRFCYLDVGKETTSKEATRGDIIQLDNPSINHDERKDRKGGSAAYTKPMHTAIVIDNYGNGVYKVVDCNWGKFRYTVRIGDWNPCKQAGKKLHVHFYRLGQVAQPNNNRPIEIGEGAPDQNSRAAFVHAYENHGGKPKAGCPTNKVHHWGNGWVQDFKGGSVDSAAIMLADGASTAYVVWGGSIWQKYISLRGAEGPLGYPTSDEIPVTASTGTQGVYQEFKDGRLTWHRNGAFPNKTFATYGAILAKYKAIGGPSHPIGLPIADEGEALRSPFGTTGTYSRFERGTINWHRDGSRAKQTFFVMGGIFEKYKAMGYSSSWLGFPISDEYDVTGGARSDFEGGNISWTPQGGMVVQPNDKPSPITDEIYNVWRNGDQAQNRYGTAAQSFKATLPFIKSVAFNAATWLNNAPGGKVHVKIFSDEAQTKLVGTYKETAVNNYGETTVTWDKPMPVNVGSTYWLQLLPVKGTKLLVYFSKYDDYSEGVLYLNWAREQSFDLNAKIKGLSKADS